MRGADGGWNHYRKQTRAREKAREAVRKERKEIMIMLAKDERGEQ